MDSFNIEDYPSLESCSREQAIIELNNSAHFHIANYKIKDKIQINSLPAIGFENKKYFIDYKIKKDDDIIKNLKVIYLKENETKKKLKIKLVSNNKIFDFPKTFYNCFAGEIEIRIYFKDNIEDFLIVYNAYLLSDELKIEIENNFKNELYRPNESHSG